MQTKKCLEPSGLGGVPRLRICGHIHAKTRSNGYCELSPLPVTTGRQAYSSECCAIQRQPWRVGLEFQQMFAVGVAVDDRVERRPGDVDRRSRNAINANTQRRRTR